MPYPLPSVALALCHLGTHLDDAQLLHAGGHPELRGALAVQTICNTEVVGAVSRQHQAEVVTMTCRACQPSWVGWVLLLGDEGLGPLSRPPQALPSPAGYPVSPLAQGFRFCP